MTDRDLPENGRTEAEEPIPAERTVSAPEPFPVTVSETVLPASEDASDSASSENAEESTQSVGRRGKKKEGSGFKAFWNTLLGKNPDGSKKKAVYTTKRQTVFRYVTVILVFLGIAGLATILYQVPKIMKEGGVRIVWLEGIFDRERTGKERDYDYYATPENAFAYRVKEDGSVAICGYSGAAGTQINIPRKIGDKTVTEIAENAFLDSDVTSVTMYETVKTIGDRAFQGCDMLFEIYLSDGLTEIGESAFYNCVTLKKIDLPSGVSEIKSYTFANCKALETVYLSQRVTVIERNAFENAGVRNIDLPSGLKTVGDNAFKNCKNLQTVSLADSVTELGTEAFYGCTSFETFTGGKGVSAIGDNCFAETAMVNQTDFKLILGDGILVKYFGNQENVTIQTSDSVKIIGEGAFENNTTMKTVSFAETVTEIRKDAFRGCSALHQLVFPKSIAKIGDNAFSGCTALSVRLLLPEGVSELGDGAFSLCTSLTGVVLPTTLKTVSANAFAKCTNLIEIEFKGQTGIGSGAFSDCSALTQVILPAEMTEIGDYAFAGCSNLKTFSAKANVSFIGENAFARCTVLKNITAPRGSYAYTWGNNHNL